MAQQIPTETRRKACSLLVTAMDHGDIGACVTRLTDTEARDVLAHVAAQLPLLIPASERGHVRQTLNAVSGWL